MADEQPRNRLAPEKLSRVAMLAMVHSILSKFDLYDCQNGDIKKSEGLGLNVKW